MFDEVKGFAVTFKRLFAPTLTIQYPEERREMAPRFRGLPSLVPIRKRTRHSVSLADSARGLPDFLP